MVTKSCFCRFAQHPAVEYSCSVYRHLFSFSICMSLSIYYLYNISRNSSDNIIGLMFFTSSISQVFCFVLFLLVFDLAFFLLVM